MGWKRVTDMSQREEFVALAKVEGANISELCRRFKISRRVGYKWIDRFEEGGGEWALDRSRRPLRSPSRVSPEIEELVLSVRDEHPVWGGRKIRRRLQDLGHAQLPSPSTITEILRRNGRLTGLEPQANRAHLRFEREAPNDLWQMDFKGWFKTSRGNCHPLTVIDDHSRFSVCVRACPDEKSSTVQSSLVPVFRRYGLPCEMLSDNGTSFGAPNSRYNRLGAWLIRLGVTVTHGRPRHPQTQGKNERFNGTLNREAIQGRNYVSLKDCQSAFDRFRHNYNNERPHEALGYEVPARRYRVSKFRYPEVLPEVEYLPGDLVFRVNAGGLIHLRSGFYPVGRAFTKELVGLRPQSADGVFDVYYCHQRVMVIDSRTREWSQK